MEAHDIAEADVSCQIDEEIVELPFGIPGSHRDGQLGKKSSWQGELAVVVAEAFGCERYHLCTGHPLLRHSPGRRAGDR